MGAILCNKSAVIEGLVLCLDAGNPASYPGSGAFWKDISGRGHRATINGATYSSDNGGCFSFDGTNDYGRIKDNSDFLFGTGSFTEEAWHKRGGNTTWEVPIVRGGSSDSDNSWGGLWIAPDGDFYPYSYTESSGQLTIDTGDAVGTDWVHHVTTTTNTGSAVTIKVYKNTVLQASASTTVSGWQPKHITVGTDLWVGGILGASYWYEGKIAICKIYKGKALTEAEILQNYNLTKGRFGL